MDPIHLTIIDNPKQSSDHVVRVVDGSGKLGEESGEEEKPQPKFEPESELELGSELESQLDSETTLHPKEESIECDSSIEETSNW
jgi:hypothetical protein